MVIICAKLFSNPTMHNKVMGRTQTGFIEAYAQKVSANCDLDLLPSGMVLVLNTLSCHANHCAEFFQIPPCITKLWIGHKQILLKSMHKV